MKYLKLGCGLTLAFAVTFSVLQVQASDSESRDFGLLVQHLLEAGSQRLFGVGQPLSQSALGPYTGINSALAVTAAKGLQVSVVSNATNSLNDMIAFWPNDVHPTHLFVAIETSRNADGTNASLQVVDLAGDPNSNARTLLTGLTATDPTRRTPWGTIVVGEESSSGGLYEIFDPLGIQTPVQITDRATGANTDPSRVFKRKAVGSLAFEGIVLMPDGTMYYGDELRPGSGPGGPGTAGGSIYKFVPSQPFSGSGPVTPTTSPLVEGTIYGIQLGTNPPPNPPDYGQGTEIGQGVWVLIDTVPDVNQNISLRTAQVEKKLTGYYRPEDMELDPLSSPTRICWTNTGRMTNGGNSVVEGAATYGEVACLVDEPSAGAVTDSIPFVTRFFQGGPDANHFDNLAFQPRSGRLVVLEDGEVESVKTVGNTQVTELRGNDMWMLLTDGNDRDVQSDGAIRILSVRDTDAEPTGFIFDASGKTAYVNIQHRSTGFGAVLKITGFKNNK